MKTSPTIKATLNIEMTPKMETTQNCGQPQSEDDTKNKDDPKYDASCALLNYQPGIPFNCFSVFLQKFSKWEPAALSAI